MITTANRLNTIKEYYFSSKLREVNHLISLGKPIINMGIGSPDLKPSPEVIQAMQDAMQDNIAHQYQSYQGITELREEIAHFYQRNFNVKLDSNAEVLPLMGSKEGIMHVSMAFLNEGDHVLIPNPGYPTYDSVTKLVGAKSVFYDLLASNNWEPDFEYLETLDLKAVKIMWVNYPHMPTGAVGSLALFQKIVDFGNKHAILIINDNPYSFVLNESPTSIFEANGAREIALELNSLSKTYNMSGWRVGMLTGNSRNIAAVLKIKSNMDSGMFYGIQKGAIAALKSDKAWFDNLNSIYSKRRDLIYQLADLLKCTYDRKAVGMFVWAKLPDDGEDAEKFIDDILYKNDVFITPGTIFGSNGNGYIRFSLCVSEKNINEAIRRIE
ncbi:pyridoxal phosphate-dependent aminotransferase [Flavobacterium ardleyense]|uniref:Aminotransferase n=1 Tax=Flavobacterium ardleyense TaxID=2038737 RepID=A0ABW5Z624_9FLAO